MEDRPVRLVVADDNVLVRLGVRAALGAYGGFAVLGEAADGATAVELVAALRPDVVLLDVRMPVRDGPSVLAELTAMAAVVMLTGVDTPDVVARAVRDGASGYLIHGTYGPAQLAESVLAAARGDTAMSPAAATALVSVLRRRPGPAAGATVLLSGRERDVMELVATGAGNGDIARRLGLTPKTVKNHLQNSYLKLGVHTRAAAVSLWWGLPEEDR